MNTTYPLRAPRALRGDFAAGLRAVRAAWDFLNMLRPSQARAQLLAMAAAQEAERPELAAQLRNAATGEWL